jgi:hypothetical protein
VENFSSPSPLPTKGQDTFLGAGRGLQSYLICGLNNQMKTWTIPREPSQEEEGGGGGGGVAAWWMALAMGLRIHLQKEPAMQPRCTRWALQSQGQQPILQKPCCPSLITLHKLCSPLKSPPSLLLSAHFRSLQLPHFHRQDLQDEVLRKRQSSGYRSCSRWIVRLR